MSMTLEQAKEKLAKYGQEHVLKYYGELTEEEKRGILDQIEATDMSILEACKHKEDLAKKGVITPLAAMQLDEIEANRENFTATGIETIRQGKVAAVLLAGGMGTRLGSDNPKGMYNVGLTHELYIFECLVNNLLEVVHQADAWIHLFVMTSDKNHEATTKFLKEKNYFGYKEEYITFFMQEMAPATDYQGKVYMEAPGVVAMSPNGNGGWFSSMKRWKGLDKVQEAGIEYLNVFAVDNVLQRIADPVFVGALIEKQAAVGSKVVKKVAKKPVEEPKQDDDDSKKKKDYALLEQQYTELQSQYNLLKETCDALTDFKNKVEDKEKDDLIASFYMLDDEDKKDVIANKSQYSLDDIEAKLSVICVRKKVNFNLEEDSQQPAPTTYNLNSDLESDVPEWLRAVDAVKSRK